MEAIVLDLLFDQPTEPKKDQALIEALRAFDGPVVAAWGDQEAGLIPAQHEYLKKFAAETGITLGFANVVTDPDGVVRRFTTRLDRLGDKLSMSGAMAELVTGESPLRDGVIDWVISPPTALPCSRPFRRT